MCVSSEVFVWFQSGCANVSGKEDLVASRRRVVELHRFYRLSA